MRIKLAAAVAAIVSMPFMALTAQASTCVSAASSVYTTSGFSCDYNGLTFSNMTINAVGTVLMGNVTPFTDGSEFGLSLNYAAVANNTGAGVLADVAWAYDVTGNLIHDAYLSLSAVITGTGTATAGETLSNGVTLSLTGPGITTALFAPVGSLSVIKDQQDFAGSAGSSNSSILRNAFSLCTQCGPPPSLTPLPGALALFLGGGGLIGLLASRRKKKAANVA